MIAAPVAPSRRFEFDRDTFAFANDLVWEYRDGVVSQMMVSRRGAAERAYTHRCFVMVRSARQFFYHARFDGGLRVADEESYRRLVHQVVSRNPRTACAETRRVVVPGYDSLREFSQAQAAVLKGNCGGAWQSYVLRSHWRMILPVSRRHQERMAAQLVRSLRERGAVILHLFRFPRLTINHGILLYGLAETDNGLKFSAYDPNCPDQPAELNYHRADRTFYFPRTRYWSGGPVNAVETFCGWLY